MRFWHVIFHTTTMRKRYPYKMGGIFCTVVGAGWAEGLETHKYLRITVIKPHQKLWVMKGLAPPIFDSFLRPWISSTILCSSKDFGSRFSKNLCVTVILNFYCIKWRLNWQVKLIKKEPLIDYQRDNNIFFLKWTWEKIL